MDEEEEDRACAREEPNAHDEEQEGRRRDGGRREREPEDVVDRAEKHAHARVAALKELCARVGDVRGRDDF